MGKKLTDAEHELILQLARDTAKMLAVAAAGAELNAVLRKLTNALLGKGHVQDEKGRPIQ